VRSKMLPVRIAASGDAESRRDATGAAPLQKNGTNSESECSAGQRGKSRSQIRRSDGGSESTSWGFWVYGNCRQPRRRRGARRALRGALRVAAGDDDAGGGVGGVELANGIARLGVGGGRDRAGFHDDDVSGRGFGCGGATAIEQLALDCGTVGLRARAAELLDIEGRH